MNAPITDAPVRGGSEDPERSEPPEWIRRPALWVAIALLGFTLGTVVLVLGEVREHSGRRAPDLPRLAALPDFELVTSDGAAFRHDDLLGRTWVVGFVFSRCRSVCPMITAAMQSTAARLEAAGNDAGMLSITVDPEFDTPSVLREYAREHRIDTGAGASVPWVLLTGELDAVRGLVVGGFLTAIGEPVEQPGGWIDIAHSGRLALVDRQGSIRGYYATDPGGLDQLVRDVRHLR